MFKRFRKVTDFGVFDDVGDGGPEDFGRSNLIYGFNYSGKTTLSRIFRCLETGTPHTDYASATVEMTDTDGRTHSPDPEATMTVRVYNEDFRKANLRWDGDMDAEPIILFGAQAITLQDELRNVKAEREAARTDNAAITAHRNAVEKNIEDAQTACGKTVKKELSIVEAFDRRHVKTIVDSWSNTVPDPLSDADFKRYKKTVGEEKKLPLPRLTIAPGAADSAMAGARNLLSTQIGRSAVIEELRSDSGLNHWVDGGRALHEDRDTCAFCGGSLTETRLAELNAHFSRDYADLKQRIAQTIETLDSRRVTFEADTYPTGLFYDDLRPRRAGAADNLEREVERWNGALDDMILCLNMKADSPFDQIALPHTAMDPASLSRAIEAMRAVIEENDRRSRDFEDRRNEAIHLLKDHYVAEAMHGIGLTSLVFQLEWARGLLALTERRLADCDARIADLHRQMSNATDGADRINETLCRFFGKDDIQVKVTPDDRFRLTRQGEPARNLSEGERTAIALCYFVTSLSANGAALSDTIVYIDDPISSLDANHLFHMNGFLKHTFYDHAHGRAWNDRYRAKQLFISTHNMEFFHLLKKWMIRNNKKGTPPHTRTFMVRRTDRNGRLCSTLEDCSKSIWQYRSVYLFAFVQLRIFLEADGEDDPAVVFNIGNMARRFLEGYLHQRLLEHDRMDDSLDRLIDEPINRDAVRKFAHTHSHVFTAGNPAGQLDMAEARRLIGVIFEAIENRDGEHYTALCREADAVMS